MNKRLAMLEQLTSAGKADAFAWYALALEYRKLSRSDDALASFRALRQKFPEYLPMYLMAGQMLLEQGHKSEAGEWLTAGIALARRDGDMKALSELEAALEETK